MSNAGPTETLLRTPVENGEEQILGIAIEAHESWRIGEIGEADPGGEMDCRTPPFTRGPFPAHGHGDAV